MTELEIMQHAKDYLNRLTKDFDPLTDCDLPENDIINNVRISCCLLFVPDVLCRRLRRAMMSRRCPASSNTPEPLSAQELKNWG
ncbi:MAG: hypothetical protein K6C12_02340 [Oscillospiraceae bacterium]|nr:hypothetical protein [Oscillospiraceae bacterium]